MVVGTILRSSQRVLNRLYWVFLMVVKCGMLVFRSESVGLRVRFGRAGFRFPGSRVGSRWPAPSFLVHSSQDRVSRWGVESRARAAESKILTSTAEVTVAPVKLLFRGPSCCSAEVPALAAEHFAGFQVPPRSSPGPTCCPG